VLKADGVLLSVTFAQPHFRRPLLLAQRYSWGMEVASFGKDLHYFVYAMRKGARKASDRPSHFAEPGPERATAQDASQCNGQATESSMHEHMDSADFLMRIEL
jgi:hypothetical protein